MNLTTEQWAQPICILEAKKGLEGPEGICSGVWLQLECSGPESRDCAPHPPNPNMGPQCWDRGRALRFGPARPAVQCGGGAHR